MRLSITILASMAILSFAVVSADDGSNGVGDLPDDTPTVVHDGKCTGSEVGICSTESTSVGDGGPVKYICSCIVS
ncbi:hypothetical protein BJV82DRAFT_597743 [Fennellomyces sp. T-0311]|nr:hypothetical protein BJV82DRAFT_597743 [Fennellomyces sp. T-0311]